MKSFFSNHCDPFDVKLICDLHDSGYIVICCLSEERDGIVGLISCSEVISDIVTLADAMQGHKSHSRPWGIFMPNGNSVFDSETKACGADYIRRAATEKW